MSDLLHSLQNAEIWDVEALVSSVEPVAPPPALRNRLMGQLERYCATGPVVDVRRNEGEWVPTGIPGVDQRLLYIDPITKYSTFHMRMAPGAVIPPHRHRTNEQCLVLEGDLHWDDLTYGPGDFVVAGAHTVHTPISTQEGALVLVVAGH